MMIVWTVFVNSSNSYIDSIWNSKEKALQRRDYLRKIHLSYELPYERYSIEEHRVQE